MVYPGWKGLVAICDSAKRRGERRLREAKGKNDWGQRRGGEREAHPDLGLAPHSPQPTGGHDLAWELRVGSHVSGAGNAVLEGGSQSPERRERPLPEVSAAGRAGALGTRGTSGSGLATAAAVGALPAGLPRSQLTAPGVPALRTVFGLACHVTDSHHRPEVACVTGTEIPAVGNVISPAGPGSWRRSGCHRRLS